MRLLIIPLFRIHLSWRKLIWFPLKSIHLCLGLLACQPSFMTFHVLETVLVLQVPFGLWYFERRTFSQRGLSLFVKSLQANPMWRALFLVVVSRIPRPPSDFGLVTDFQLSRQIFLFSLVSPQMKFLRVLSIWRVESAGRLVYCMMWEGILLRVALARVALPVRLRRLVFHSTNLFLMLSNMNWKSLDTGLLQNMGNQCISQRLHRAQC